MYPSTLQKEKRIQVLRRFHWPGMMFIMLIVHLPAKAQLLVGIQGGYGQNQLYTDLGNYVFAKYKPVNGYTVGIPVQYQFNDWLAVQGDLSYLQKSYRLERSGFFDGLYQTTTNSYLQLPVMAHFSFGGSRLRGFTNAGLYAAYWLKSRIKGLSSTLQFTDPSYYSHPVARELDQTTPYRYDEAYPFDKKRDQRLETGWVGGAGVSYQLSSFCRLFIEGRYYYSVTDMQKNYMIGQMPRYNQTWMLQTGILTQLKRR